VIGGKVVHVAFGTTKYCSFYLRNAKCPNSDCVYLHYVGGENDSFTKEDMIQGITDYLL
jgi:CCR4-NOT transcription complex subunit 4